MAKLMEVGRFRFEFTVENPGAPVPDGDGGFTETFTPLVPPTVMGSIERATAIGLERVAAGTVLTQATHIIRCRYHSGITTETRMSFNGRSFNVIAPPNNLGERNERLEIVATEIVT